MGSEMCIRDRGYACCCSTVKNSYCTGEDGKKAFEEEGNMLMMTGAADDNDEVPENAENADLARESEQADGKDQEQDSNTNGKKRTLEELKSGVTEEEFESYKRSRLAAEDPMAKFLGKD